MRNLGTPLMLAGIILLALGIFFSMGGSLSWLGRLPGDIRLERPGVRLYFPLTTSVLLSVVFSLIMYVIRMLR